MNIQGREKQSDKEPSKPQYIVLGTGDIIQKSDEYCTGQGVWRGVPDFLCGEVVKEGTTEWRRPVKKEQSKKISKTKKSWFK